MFRLVTRDGYLSLHDASRCLIASSRKEDVSSMLRKGTPVAFPTSHAPARTDTRASPRIRRSAQARRRLELTEDHWRSVARHTVRVVRLLSLREPRGLFQRPLFPYRQSDGGALGESRDVRRGLRGASVRRDRIRPSR